MSVPVRLPRLEDWKAQVKCQAACPVATDAGRYVQLISEGRDEDAYLVARAPNPFASVCGRVCAAPCEDACRRGAIDAPITIRGLKRYVTEQFGVESVHPDTQARLRSELISEGNRYAGHLPVAGRAGAGSGRAPAVAVIGAGPAGMSAAHDLALLGYRVTVFEAGPEPGGMMRFGIPEYRLPRSIIRSEIDAVASLGVRLLLNTPLTKDFGLAALRREGFEAVFLSVGVWAGRDLPVPGVDLDGVVKAVDYLLNVNRGYRMDLGSRVVVVGGGFVAFDAARTALRVQREEDLARLQSLAGAADARVKEAFDSARAALRGGAAEVTIVSLETFDEMPVLRTTQGHEEFEEAKREGIAFLTRRGPKRFLGDSRLRQVELRKVLSVFDASGRFAPTYDDNDVVLLDADACVLAIGQKPDLSFLDPSDGVTLTPGGTIAVNPVSLATSAPGVFAGGDVAFGPRNLIEAVANGKRAARSIHEYLSPEQAHLHSTLAIERFHTPHYRMIAGFEKLDREAPPTLDIGRRTGIAEVETGYDDEAARAQAARCLVCHVQTIYDPEKCVLCNRCVDVCPEYCLAIVPFDDLELDAATRDALIARAEAGGLPLSAMVKDDERCIRCGLCALRCPTDAMTMERFTITERLVALPPGATASEGQPGAGTTNSTRPQP
jgi:NADPH-dependent glutamate synthase beta subunit-like oxidoreductase